MHESVMKFLERHKYLANGCRVLEIGSYNVNGSARDAFYHWDGHAENRSPHWIGIDLKPCDHDHTPCVDLVMNFCDHNSVGAMQHVGLRDSNNKSKLVVCTETLEHVQYWRSFVLNLSQFLDHDCHLLLTTRSPGFGRHEYPGDYWRFTVKNMLNIWDHTDILCVERDPDAPGVFLHCKGCGGLMDKEKLSQIDVERAPEE